MGRVEIGKWLWMRKGGLSNPRLFRKWTKGDGWAPELMEELGIELEVEG